MFSPDRHRHGSACRTYANPAVSGRRGDLKGKTFKAQGGGGDFCQVCEVRQRSLVSHGLNQRRALRIFGVIFDLPDENQTMSTGMNLLFMLIRSVESQVEQDIGSFERLGVACRR